MEVFLHVRPRWGRMASAASMVMTVVLTMRMFAFAMFRTTRDLDLDDVYPRHTVVRVGRAVGVGRIGFAADVFDV